MDRTREADTERVGDPHGAAFTAALAGMVRGHKLTVTMLSETRFKVSAGPGSRALEIEARPRQDDGDRWWFCWSGTVWLCEADNPTDALVQIKGALRQVGADRGVSWVAS
ncbi:hypothetical protein [Actinomadura hibisca]|uniref:hypothetical protein n=1 Tax=Actinomadura hibisca TaxID=68565 RepID=UPI0012FAC793|nr:hypothetical protein [Actinomadura hibisca]